MYSKSITAHLILAMQAIARIHPAPDYVILDETGLKLVDLKTTKVTKKGQKYLVQHGLCPADPKKQRRSKGDRRRNRRERWS